MIAGHQKSNSFSSSGICVKLLHCDVVR